MLSHIWIHGKIRYSCMLPLILLQRVGFYTYISNLHRCIFLFPYIIFDYTLHDKHCKSFFDTKVTHQKSLFCNWYATLRQYPSFHIVYSIKEIKSLDMRWHSVINYSHDIKEWTRQKIGQYHLKYKYNLFIIMIILRYIKYQLKLLELNE